MDDNKTELFRFLADVDFTTLIPSGKLVLVTRGDTVRKSDSNVDISDIAPCNHEEADTRILLHCKHAAQCEFESVAIRTVDTDIVVLAVSFFLN